MKKKILICGATGFIGRNLTEQLSRRSDLEVHAVRFQRPEYHCPNVIWHQADLRKPESIEHIMNESHIIIQAAASSPHSKNNVNRPYLHVTDNAVMNSYLFRAAFEQKAKHVIFFSCASMYQQSEIALKECDFDANLPLDLDHFDINHSKLYIEKLCEFYANISEMKFTVIRNSNIYGSHDKFDLDHSNVVGSIITKIMTAEDRVTIHDAGDKKYDLLYIDDLVEFVELSIEKQSEKYRVYNCGSGQAIAIKDLVQKIVKHSGKNLQIEHDLSSHTPKASSSLNCELAKKEFGWEPKTSLDEGIQKTLAWWDTNIGENEEAA